jgi:hypothetical protein
MMALERGRCSMQRDVQAAPHLFLSDCLRAKLPAAEDTAMNRKGCPAACCGIACSLLRFKSRGSVAND